MTRVSIFILLICSALLPAQELVRRQAGSIVARGRLKIEQGRVSGEMLSAAFQMNASLELAADGRVLSFRRELRSRDPDHLIQRVSLKEGGKGYVLREETALGSRTLEVNVAPVFLVLDPEWPEAMIPAMMAHRGEYLRVLDLETRKADIVPLRPRLKGARFLDLPQGGVTLELDPKGAFARLLVPGEQRLEILPTTASGSPSLATPADVLETDVALHSGDATLRGLVARPRKPSAARPGIVLLADAGARDRNGDGPGSGTGLLAALAHGLARSGFVSVRWDKRGSFASQGPDRGLAGLLADARTAAVWLRSQAGVAGQKVVFLGHGEGGLLAVQAALKRPELAQAVVTLGAPARSLRFSLQARLRDQLRARGESLRVVEEQVSALRQQLAALGALAPKQDPGEGNRLLRDLLSINPTDSYQRLKCPLLILYGADDDLVPTGHRALLRSSLSLIRGFSFSFHNIQQADHEFLQTDAQGRSPPGRDHSVDVARPRNPALILFLRDFLKKIQAASSTPRDGGP